MKRSETVMKTSIAGAGPIVVFLIVIFSVAGCHGAGQASSRPPAVTDLTTQRSSTDLSTQAATALADGPLRVSSANPRYFTAESGRAVYLCGSHTWFNLQDMGPSDPPPAFDYDQWLDFLEAYHLNFFRLWTWEQTKGFVNAKEAFYLAPSPYQRTGPGAALDGKPKFDLTKFDQTYFDRLRERVIAAGERGIYVSVMLFNGWSVSYPKGEDDVTNPWLGHPFNARNNINGVDGDPDGDGSGDETQRLSSPDPAVLPAYTAYQEAYVKKVIDTVNDLDNVLFEIANESNGGSGTVNWQYHMIDLIHEYEKNKPKQHPVGMTVPWPDGDNSQLLSSPAEWISPNSPYGVSLDYPPIADGRKVVVTDTDHLVGIGGNRAWAWKGFTQGENLLFMDSYDTFLPGGGRHDVNDPDDVNLRQNLGYIRVYADRMNLLAMKPRGDLSSSGYALANPVTDGAEYLVYQPEAGSVTVDLRDASGELSIEWLNPNTGATYSGGTTMGGDRRSLSPPFTGDSVLYLSSADGGDPSSPTFSDTPPHHPYYSQITALVTRGVVSGYGGNRFGPDDPLTRQQFAKMIVLALGLPVTVDDVCPFGDVAQGTPGSVDPLYPANYVAVAAAHGITVGKTATTFAPYASLTRAQLITLVARAAHLPLPPADYAPPFRDFSDDHYPWARRAAYAGLLEGEPGASVTSDFWAPATRGEACWLLYSMLQRLEMDAGM